MLQEKYKRLQELLRSEGRIAVAFSGGTDSSFLLAAAVDTLGTEQVLALTASSVFFPKEEQEDAEDLCRILGVRQKVCQVQVLEISGIRQNPVDRCYHCKKHLFTRFLQEAEKERFYVVAEGTNADDVTDYRPGRRAVEELGVKSPLLEAGFTKQEIRTLSKEMGLSTWEKPAAACLASRFVYGETINEERLGMVEQAERILRQVGFSQIRVRIHGEGKGIMARIELLSEEIPRLMEDEVRMEIQRKLYALGFSYVTADLLGFHSGSMNLLVNREEEES